MRKKVFACVFIWCLVNTLTQASPKTTNDMNIAMSDRFCIEEHTEEYLGEFTITHYCGCEICNGNYVGMAAKNGEALKENYTIAVDESIIPLNTYVIINDKEYKACDTGSAIKGNKIDIFINDHNKCLELGKVTNVKVYKINK